MALPASVAETAKSMFVGLQSNVSVGDYVKFVDQLHPNGLGEIVSCSHLRVKLRLFRVMDSVAMQLNFLSPLNTRDHPLASQDELIEVYQSSEEMYITRNQISDVAFILPIQEVESGRFFLSSSENSFVIRYSYDNNHMIPWATSFYFSRCGVEPLGVHLFHALNTLSDYLRRLMCHRPESETTSQSFKLPMFSPESFYYLAFKLADKSIHLSIHQKQQSIKYYNS
jgi:hypothetical protein